MPDSKSPRRPSAFMAALGQQNQREPTPEPQEEQSPQQQAPSSPSQQEEQQAFLWNSRPPVGFTDRRFEYRHKRQAIYVNVRYAGAFQALIRITEKRKNTIIQSMILRLLQENEQLLLENADEVRYYEDKIRQEFHL